MRGLRTGLLVVVAVLVIAGATLPFTLPPLVRWFAIRQIRAVTGREASIERVDLDLWRLQVAAVNVRVEGRVPGEPVLTVDRIESRLRLAELLRGRVRLLLNSGRIERPWFRLVRQPDGTLDLDDVLARQRSEAPATASTGESRFQLDLQDLRVDHGTLIFEDRAVTPPATFTLADLTVGVSRLSTQADDPPGEGELTATLNGRPLRLALTRIDLAPVTAQGTLTLDALPLHPAWSYVSTGGLRPAGGILTLRLDVDHVTGQKTRVGLDLRVAEPRLVRPGQPDPAMTAPVLTLVIRDLEGQGGAWRLGRLELAAEPTFFPVPAGTPGPSGAPAATSRPAGAAGASRPLTVAPLRLIAEDFPLTAGPPGRIALTAALTDGATLDVKGSAGLPPLVATVDLTLARLDTAIIRRFLPPDPAVSPTRGQVDARLALAYEDGRLRASGEVGATGLDLSRRGQAAPLASHPRIRLQVDDLAWGGGRVDVRHLALTGAPRIVDAGPDPPLVVEMKSLGLEADDVSWPSDRPAFVRLAGAAADGGTLAVAGTFNPATLDTRVRVEAAGIDLRPFAVYVPPTSPLRPGAGTLFADLRLGYDAPTLQVSGDLRVRDLRLLRRDQAEPFVSHPELHVSVADLALAGGDLAVRRLRVEGSPTIVDGTVTPPARASFSQLAMTAEGFTWPARGPTRVQIEARSNGGGGTITGTVHPGTVATDVTARLAALDLTPASAYLPPSLGLDSGRLDATLRLRYERATGFRLDGDTAVAGLALGRRGTDGAAGPPAGPGPLLVAAPRLALAVESLRFGAGAFGVDRLGLTAAPTVADGSGNPARAVTLRGLRLEAQAVRVPGNSPGRVSLALDLPEAGTLTVSGTVATDGRAADLALALRDAALSPWQAYLPMDAALAGWATGDLRLGLQLRGTTRVDAHGALAARDVRLGPADRPPLAVARLDLQDIAVEWPGEVRIGRIGLAGFQGLIERERDGTLPLRRMFAARRPASPSGSGDAPAPTPMAATPGASSPPGDQGPSAGGTEPTLVVRIDQLAVDDGALRFVDRAGEPFYSEELTGLVIRVANFTTRPEPPADLTLQGVIGNTGALDLTGRLSAFATPFVLDLDGELREFPLPRTNPVFRRLFAWFLKRGSLTTRVHYRIVGDQLDAQNRVEVRRLDVEKERAPDADKRLSLPLGLIVALATDSRGDIAFDLPVKGKLGSPELSLGGAIWAALKNLLANVVTGPFQAIGGLFGKGEEAEDLKVDPIPFPPGSATLDAAGDRQVQKVADFLRASPNVALELRPVAGKSDLVSLRAREVTARVQRVQREQGLPTFEAAAARLHAEAFPGVEPPASPEAVVDALRDREPVPEAALRDLLVHRVEATRQAFVERTGVAAERLRPADEGSTMPSEDERGGVELALAP